MMIILKFIYYTYPHPGAPKAGLIAMSFRIFFAKHGSSLFFSPSGEIYGLVHVRRQPEREICEKKKDLKVQWGKKGT